MGGALILTGAPGSGKSSVLDALSTLLEIDEVPFGAVETEHLARGWPWLAAQQWLPQLGSTIAFHRAVGRETFLIVATTETPEELEAVIAAVAAEPVLVVCLTVPPELAAARVAQREPDAWPGKPALVEHARALAEEIPLLPGLDAVLSTAEREAAEVAREVRALLSASAILRPPGRRESRR